MLNLIAKNTGTSFSKRWLDLATPEMQFAPEKTGDEIALDIMQRAGLRQKGGE